MTQIIPDVFLVVLDCVFFEKGEVVLQEGPFALAMEMVVGSDRRR